MLRRSAMHDTKTESFSMKVLRSFGLDSLAWTLRRYHVPVRRSDLVLEVGSGGNPYPRANVLVDAFENTQERHWAPLITDRKTVIAFGENLPFKDKAFDFVICSHVLEHSANPERFLAELQRVARAGYIEVPHAFMERVIPYNDHRLEIYSEDNKLKILKKSSANVDPELHHLFLNQPNRVFSRFLISKKPFDFHVRFYWQDQIYFEVQNPHVDINWTPLSVSYSQKDLSTKISSISRSFLLRVIRFVFSQNFRNRTLNLENVLFCRNCSRTSFKAVSKSKAVCHTCENSLVVWN